MTQEPRSTGQFKNKPKVIAAIPCFNEERCIGSVVIKAKRFVESVIVIDDGSTDATAEVATGAGAEVYQHGKNRGYGAAIRSALEKGRQLGADVLVILDGDGQHDPRDIPKLIKPLLDGEADVVIGSRFLGKGKKPPFYRRLGQHALTAATNLGSGQKVTDSQSGFRAYSAKALKEMNRVLRKGGLLHGFVPCEGGNFAYTKWSSKIGRGTKETFGGHIQQFTTRQIEDMLASNRFSLKKTVSSGHLLYQLVDFLFFSSNNKLLHYYLIYLCYSNKILLLFYYWLPFFPHH